MASSPPYTYIQCPCSNEEPAEGSDASSPESDSFHDAERTFDPRAPRSNYSLYPLEYLLYCEECQQIRCPRCVDEEIVTYYCPNCLFEVASSNLRSDGNRCTRNCYQCPICSGPVQVGEVQAEPETNLLSADNATAAPHGPYALFCQYCSWVSSEIGLEFERASGIPSQLAKMKNGGIPRITAKELKERRKEDPDMPPLEDELVDAELQYSALRSFYQSQINGPSNGLPGGLSLGDGHNFSSPAALTRMMSMWQPGGRGAQGKTAGPPDVFPEATDTDKGLKLAQLDESAKVQKLLNGGWNETVSKDQLLGQLEHAHFQDELRPLQCVLRTKRSRRCAVCRHIISKPENKVASTRFKIKLVAKSYIPSISIRPLEPRAPPVPVGMRPQQPQEPPLKPLQPYQYILTFKNPLFEKLKVTLATPNNTPGRFSSKVALLCPQFDIDPVKDMWEDALDGDDRSRTEETGQAEAGKIYKRGRNWVSIILEVIPPLLSVDSLRPHTASGEPTDRSPLREDEKILEIPMFVRMEWEPEAQHDVGDRVGKDRNEGQKRELAYWCVLGVGQISHE
ncbi:dynactin p62 family-domain-containing protein [Emericellopsis atlantica]|uniref:Dynactin subunit 4 n=1 Tax=Emericellopsis atlantica TaxID=2614577 RepID=A0A9P8CSF5_9HYPO|nr:dynactin p62 family-domain-containing protein [Emericellopsis atlantica]KAG9257160.1 dynactin p62 family-domain-containing protein [Emericellopsis atlantica]